MIDVAAIETAVRAWVVAAVNDAAVPVIFGQQSAPRPASPYVAIWRTGIDQPEWDEPHAVEEHPVTAVNQGARRFTVAGDARLFYPAGAAAIVADSTGNDGTYTVASATFAGGNTAIVVVEAVPSAVADGVLTGARRIVGTRILTFQIDCIGGTALQRAEGIKAALAKRTILDALSAAGCAVYRSERIQDLTGLVDTVREARAAFTTRIAVASTEHETTGIIERVTGTATTLDVDGTALRADPLIADQRVTPYEPG